MRMILNVVTLRLFLVGIDFSIVCSCCQKWCSAVWYEVLKNGFPLVQAVRVFQHSCLSFNIHWMPKSSWTKIFAVVCPCLSLTLDTIIYTDHLCAFICLCQIFHSRWLLFVGLIASVVVVAAAIGVTAAFYWLSPLLLVLLLLLACRTQRKGWPQDRAGSAQHCSFSYH